MTIVTTVLSAVLSLLWPSAFGLAGGARLRSAMFALGITGAVAAAGFAALTVGRILLHDPAPAIAEAVREATVARDDVWTAQLTKLTNTALTAIRELDRAAAQAAADQAAEHEHEVGLAADRIAQLEEALAARKRVVAYPRAVVPHLNR
jgi:hypothetical protein